MIRFLSVACLALFGPSCAAAQQAGVAWCDDLPVGQAGLQDCGLVAGETVLVFDYDSVPDGAILRLTQVVGDADPVQMAAVPVKPIRFAPSLRRLSQDAPDLLLPVSADGDDVVFEIWVQGPAGLFGPQGTLTGPDPDAFFRRDGLVIQVVPNGPTTHIETGFTLTDAGFVTLYAVEIEAADGSCAWITGAASVNTAAILADCASRQRG